MKSSTLFATLPIILSLASVSLGANVCAYSSRNCIGGASCCNNLPINTCCSITGAVSGAYGWSVGFSSMPTTTWVGMAFGTPGCGTMTAGGSASCLSVYNEPNRLAFQATRWGTSFLKAGITADGEVVKEEDASLCMTPNGVAFTTADGVEHNVDVPEGEMDRALKLMEAGRYNELLKYKKVAE